MNNHQQQLAYDRHVHFIDFRNFIGNSTENYQPIWFSVIRDPIEKFVSRYNYNRYLFEFSRTAYSQDKRVGISKKKLLSFFSSTILTLDIIIYFKYMKITTNCIILFTMHTKIFPEMEKLLYLINQSPKMIQLCLVCRKKNGKVKILWIVFLMTRMKNVI